MGFSYLIWPVRNPGYCKPQIFSKKQDSSSRNFPMWIQIRISRQYCRFERFSTHRRPRSGRQTSHPLPNMQHCGGKGSFHTRDFQGTARHLLTQPRFGLGRLKIEKIKKVSRLDTLVTLCWTVLCKDVYFSAFKHRIIQIDARCISDSVRIRYSTYILHT